MAHAITDLCTLCGTCTEVCPTECIKEGDDQFYIDPEECIDCASCIDECPESAIFAEEDLPDDKKFFVEKNASFFS